MFIPNRPWLTIEEIATLWSREDNRHTTEEIEQDLRGAIFRREFEGGELGWAYNLMNERLYPDEFPQSGLPSNLSLEHGLFQIPAVEHGWENEGGALLTQSIEDRRARLTNSSFPDFERMSSDYRSEIWTMLCDTASDDFALELLGKDMGLAFRYLGEARPSKFTEQAHIVFQHIAIMKSALVRWCGDRGIEPPEFLGETTPSYAETQTEQTLQSDDANPDTPDAHETAQNEPGPQMEAGTGRYEAWTDEAIKLHDAGDRWIDAAAIIADKSNLSTNYVAREVRRVRKKRESGKKREA